jgi:hypothetical protein
MPQVIEHIDKIAREKQRNVLYLTFTDTENKKEDELFQIVDYENHPARNTIIAWLERHKVPYDECAGIASENMMVEYMGQLYIDVPYELNNPDYQKLQHFLEDENGEVRFDGVAFWVLSLELAMKNAHHDEPGFWDRWAENF